MSRHPFGWSYPAGAENDPNAPYNQPDPIEDTDEFQDKKLEMWNEAIMDTSYMLEAIGERPEDDLKMLARAIRGNQNGTHTVAIGAWVTEWVTKYCEPRDDEVLEELNQNGDY
jgi:hypothetical protein